VLRPSDSSARPSLPPKPSIVGTNILGLEILLAHVASYKAPQKLKREIMVMKLTLALLAERGRKSGRLSPRI